eukprot:9503957-Pyramimonas_sp.AAC.3
MKTECVTTPICIPDLTSTPVSGLRFTKLQCALTVLLHYVYLLLLHGHRRDLPLHVQLPGDVLRRELDVLVGRRVHGVEREPCVPRTVRAVPEDSPCRQSGTGSLTVTIGVRRIRLGRVVL